MPIIYLSPSTQSYNLYVTGGSEQDYMNSLANEMEPYLTASGISYDRKSLDMTAAQAIRASNAGQYDLHLALHSNASPEEIAGTQRGIIVFYNASSSESQKAASLIAEKLKSIYPLPDQVRVEPSTTVGEVTRVTAPPAFLEIGYHDNPEDALWITTHLEPLAKTIVSALAEYFGTPFLTPVAPRPGRVAIKFGHLNIRERPSISAPIIATALNGTPVTILNQYQGWYLIQLGKILGYASDQFIVPL